MASGELLQRQRRRDVVVAIGDRFRGRNGVPGSGNGTEGLCGGVRGTSGRRGGARGVAWEILVHPLVVELCRCRGNQGVIITGRRSLTTSLLGVSPQ